MRHAGTVIAVANTKGGVGKTTIATSLAVYLAALGKRAGLVALDPQSDLLDWSAKRRERGHEPVVEVYAGVDALDDVAENMAAAGLDYLIVDCPPHFLGTVEQALAAADLVVIPIKGSGFDLWAKETIMTAVATTGTPHLVLINESPPGWKITKAARTVLEARGLMLSETDIKTRADYRTAPADGLTAAEIERADDAAVEIAAVWGQITQALKAWKKKSSKPRSPAR